MKTQLKSALILTALFSVSALVPLSAADQAPMAISRSAPVYAFDLRKAEIEGAVLVSFNITPLGDVADAVVISSTHRVFEEPTLNAIKRWKFTPAIKDGLAISVPARQLVTFTNTGRSPQTSTATLIANLKPHPPARIVASLK